MKKLDLGALAVDTFETTAPGADVRGTVAAHAQTLSNCPVSWNGTCWITCPNTCPCTEVARCA